jgi:Fatty acid desaturase.
MASAVTRVELTRAEQFEILAGLSPNVVAETEAHISRRRLWFPESLLPASAEGDGIEEVHAELRAAARALPDTVRVSLAMNLLTEEGLPHFHRLIVVHLGSDGAWSNWNNLWTAEEDRHGCILRDYVRDARLFDMSALEQMQYRYIESGFNPDWERDPYRLLAYTSLQERATQMAHANTGRACSAYESTAQRILANVSGDESRHYQFYRNMFAAILAADPDRALYALLKVMPALAMPGHTIPGYDQMAEVIRRSDIYGPRPLPEDRRGTARVLGHRRSGRAFGQRSRVPGEADEGAGAVDANGRLPRRQGHSARLPLRLPVRARHPDLSIRLPASLNRGSRNLPTALPPRPVPRPAG